MHEEQQCWYLLKLSRTFNYLSDKLKTWSFDLQMKLKAFKELLPLTRCFSWKSCEKKQHSENLQSYEFSDCKLPNPPWGIQPNWKSYLCFYFLNILISDRKCVTIQVVSAKVREFHNSTRPCVMVSLSKSLLRKNAITCILATVSFHSN